jgi:hypothetical protein
MKVESMKLACFAAIHGADPEHAESVTRLGKRGGLRWVNRVAGQLGTGGLQSMSVMGGGLN